MKNSNKKSDRILIISFAIITIISMCLVPNASQKNPVSNFEGSDNLRFLNTSDTYLNYSSIIQNGTSVYRVFDYVKFEVNTSGFSGVDSTIMRVEFNDLYSREYEMYEESTDFYRYDYIAEYDTPLGFHNITFGIYDISKVQLNDQTTKTNITVLSNCVGYVNNTEYERNQEVYGEVIVTDFGPYNLEWNVAVVDNTNESIQSTLFDLGMDIDHFKFEINELFDVSEVDYYVKINMSDTLSSKVAASYLPFKVLSTDPTIKDVTFSINPLKRDEDCELTLNVSDIDPLTVPKNITVTMKLQASNGQNLSPLVLTNNEDWSFDLTFSISIDRPIGMYQVTIEAEDQYGSIGAYATTLNVINNAPEIHNYWINSLSIEQQISINYGEDLVFTFNASDKEDTIAYITVSLLDENNNWYNITNSYSSDMELTIRTEELISGIWYVYLSVMDVDGAITRFSSDISLGPKEIRIIPDLISDNLPWIALFSGLAIGILFGFIIGFSRNKLKAAKIPREKQKVSKGKAKKIKKSIKPDNKQKQVSDDKPDDKEDKSMISETTSDSQRKIKRRLN